MNKTREENPGILVLQWLPWAVFALYPLSHLPEIRIGGLGLSLLQIAQLLVIITIGFSLVFVHSFREDSVAWAARHRRLATALGIFLLWVTLSLAWSDAPLRSQHAVALLFAGALFGAALVLWANYWRPDRRRLEQVIIGAGLALAVFCLWQFIGDNRGVPIWLTQILPTTTWTQIDFTRVNGLSIEPQFLTTILLLPAALLYSRARRDSALPWWNGLLLIDMAVLLALSRGGFIAHLVLGAVWLAVWVLRKQWRAVAERLFAFGLALLAVLALLAWSGTLPGHKGAGWVVNRYIEHGTGGLIKTQTKTEPPTTTSQDTITQVVDPQDTTPIASVPQDSAPEVITPQSDNIGGRDEIGVVEESTLERLDTYRTAISIWRENPRNMVIGVGWGAFGTNAERYNDLAFEPHSIVNNQPLQILTELGLVGTVLAAGLVVMYLRALGHLDVLSVSLLSAMGIQLLFYSALHLAQIWISLAFVLLWTSDKRKET